MADATSGTSAASSGRSKGSQRVMDILRRGDIAMALGVVAILVVLILPLPKWLMDISLAGSIMFSVLILMTALFIEKPLQFNSFPTVLLLATLLRLSLNLASTRLILANGHLGTDAAGKVIEAFGGFVMGGSFVIGIIVFTILIIVNFVVITKGAGRIAEVSARFTLDAMPGKQMAIDADLSTGLIDEDEAKRRRKELEDESTFFGAMDGAAKFVRGDVVAGLLITFINIVAGMIIGVAQMDLTFAEAAENYTRLTVGDGLVTQIPALIVSTAAGMVVTKAGLSGATEKALFRQLAGQPRALGLSSFLLASLAVLPGIPAVPFLLLAGSIGLLAWYMNRIQVKAEVEEKARIEREVAAAPPVAEEPISATLRIDFLRLELGYGLLSMINSPRNGHRLTDQIKALRRQLAQDMGFVMPSVRIQDNMQLPANTYVIRLKEIETGRGDLRPAMLMIMDPRGEDITLPGEKTNEPTFGLPAMWIDENNREEALFPRLHGGRPGHRDHHAPDRGDQGQHGRVAVLRRDPEADGRIGQGTPETDRRHDSGADFGRRHPAGASEPVERAHLDSRPADHPGSRFRSLRPHPQRDDDHRACPGPAVAPDQRHEHQRPGIHPAGHAVARMGAELRRIAGRRRRGTAAFDGAEPPAGIHRQPAPDLRTPSDDGRIAGTVDEPQHSALCAFDRRTVPPVDGRDVAE